MNEFAGNCAPGLLNGWVKEEKILIYQTMFFFMFIIVFMNGSKLASFPVN